MIGKWVFEGPTREEGVLGPQGTLVRIVVEHKWPVNNGPVIAKGVAEIDGKQVFEALDVTTWDPVSKKIVTNSVGSRSGPECTLHRTS